MDKKLFKMNLYRILICISLLSFSCNGKQDVKTPTNNLLETKNDDQIIISGDYIFYDNAGVLQTNKNVYGIIINDKAEELNKKLSSIKENEFDFVPVILKGKLFNKKENEEGWSVKFEIIEIVEIIKK